METGEVPWYDKIFVMLSVASEGSLEWEIGSARRFELSSAAKRAQSAWEIVSYLRALPDHKRREWCLSLRATIPAAHEGVAGPHVGLGAGANDAARRNPIRGLTP